MLNVIFEPIVYPKFETLGLKTQVSMQGQSGHAGADIMRLMLGRKVQVQLLRG